MPLYILVCEQECIGDTFLLCGGQWPSLSRTFRFFLPLLLPSPPRTYILSDRTVKIPWFENTVVIVSELCQDTRSADLVTRQVSVSRC